MEKDYIFTASVRSRRNTGCRACLWFDICSERPETITTLQCAAYTPITAAHNEEQEYEENLQMRHSASAECISEMDGERI